MRRNTKLALLFVAVLAVSGIVVGASGFDNLFTGTEDIDDDEITLSVADTPQGQAYAELDGDDNLDISIDNLNPDSDTTVDGLFNATYNGDSEGYIYFENTPSEVTIVDSNGDSVEGSANSVNFTATGETESFGVEIDATGQGSISITSIDVVAGAQDATQPTAVVFNGTAADDVGVDAPAETEIVASVVGSSQTDTTQVDENGIYGDSGFGDDIELDVNEGDEVAFYVREDGGPEHLETYTVTQDDIDTASAQEDLVFPEATFDLQVLNFNVNETEVDQGDVIEVSADLTNNGSITLDQNANLTVDGDTVQTEDNVPVAGGDSEPVSFEYEVEQAQNFTIGISTDDDSADQEIEVLSNIVFFGDVTDGTTDAPEDTVIATTINGEPAGTGTVNESGQYDLGLSVEEGDDVEFFVRDTDGPEPTNIDDPISIEEADIGENIEQELVFEAGTFDLNVLNIDADPSEVQPGEEVEISADLENNGGVALTQDVTFEIDGETVETNESFTVDAGDEEPISFTRTPTTSDDFTAAISTDDDDDSVAITVDGIVNVEDGTFDNDFAGTVLDDDDLNLTASNVQNASGTFDGSVPIQLNTSTDTSIEIGSVDVTDGDIDAQIDPEADIPVDVDLGDATIELAGVQTDATVNVIHEAQSFGTGATVTSAPQAAQLYAEGAFSTTQWDDANEEFNSDAIDSQGTFTDATNVHRGLYVITNDPDFRFGWEYQGAQFNDGDTADLSAGWNLVSSNYNISDGQVSVADDLALSTDTSNVEIFDANDGTEITDPDTADSGEYDAYWVFTGSSDDVTRTLDVSAYSASDRAES